MGDTDERVTIKIPLSLAQAIDPYLSCKNEFGIALWDDRTKFTVAAIQAHILNKKLLLDSMQVETVKA